MDSLILLHFSLLCIGSQSTTFFFRVQKHHMTGQDIQNYYIPTKLTLSPIICYTLKYIKKEVEVTNGLGERLNI